jgi:hypothetical protein
MKFARKLWLLTLFLAFVMVIPSVALAQDYDLTGTWIWQAREVCNDFHDGSFSMEPETIEFCILHDTITNLVEFSGADPWTGYTSSYFIGAAIVEPCARSVLSGKVSKNGNSISGKLVYYEFPLLGCSFEDYCTASYSFQMRKVSDTCP